MCMYVMAVCLHAPAAPHSHGVHLRGHQAPSEAAGTSTKSCAITFACQIGKLCTHGHFHQSVQVQLQNRLQRALLWVLAGLLKMVDGCTRPPLGPKQIP